MKALPGDVIGPLTVGTGTAAVTRGAGLEASTIAAIHRPRPRGTASRRRAHDRAIDSLIVVPPWPSQRRAVPPTLGTEVERCQANPLLADAATWVLRRRR